MNIDRVIAGNLKTNVWLVEGEPETPSAAPHVVVIDPGEDTKAILAAVGQRTVDAVLLTHGHFDHIGVADEVADELHTFLYMPAAEMEILPALCEDVRRRWQIDSQPPLIDFQVSDGQVLHLAGLDFTVFHTPGHTPGSSGYLVTDPATGIIHYFSGDTLFARDLGRTDLLGGNPEAMERSVERIAATLPPDTQVYPGHGPTTTIAREAASNSYWPS